MNTGKRALYWFLGTTFFQIIPVLCAGAATALADDPKPLEEVVGSSLILVVAFGTMGVVAVDVMIDRHRLAEGAGLAAVGCVVFLSIAMYTGMMMDAKESKNKFDAAVNLKSSGQHTDESPVQFTRVDWAKLKHLLLIQLGVSLLPLVLCTVTKGNMLACANASARRLLIVDQCGEPRCPVRQAPHI